MYLIFLVVSLIGSVMFESKYDLDMDMFEMMGYFVLFTVYAFLFYYVARGYS